MVPPARAMMGFLSCQTECPSRAQFKEISLSYMFLWKMMVVDCSSSLSWLLRKLCQLVAECDWLRQLHCGPLCLLAGWAGWSKATFTGVWQGRLEQSHFHPAFFSDTQLSLQTSLLVACRWGKRRLELREDSRIT